MISSRRRGVRAGRLARDRRRRRAVLLVATMLAAFVALTLPGSAATQEAPQLLFSTQPNRTPGLPLGLRAVTGKIAVYMPAAPNVKQVDFYLDDWGATRAPYRSDTTAPYDMNGEMVNGDARMWDTAATPDGLHLVIAIARFNDGSSVSRVAAIQAINTGAGSTQPVMRWSRASDRSNPQALDGAVVSGDIYGMLDASGLAVANVTFVIDGAGVMVDSQAPYDLMGALWNDASKPNPYSTSKLSDGVHQISAIVQLKDGSTRLVASDVYVANVTAAPAGTWTMPPAPTSSGALPTVLPTGAMTFTSDRVGGIQVFIDRRDGSEPYGITTGTTYDNYWPRLSPDHRKILFGRTPHGVPDTDYTQTSVWVVNVDGSGLTQLLPAHANGWYWLAHPEWSPDGKTIAVVAGPQSDSEIWFVDADGTHPRQVTDRPGSDVDPSFSPDGKTLAFVGCAQGGGCLPEKFEIFTMPIGGGPAKQITNDNLRDNDPYFSLDGRSISFITQAAGTSLTRAWNVRVAAADGSSVRYVTTSSNTLDSPAHWSLDNQWLVFHRITLPVTRGPELYQVHPDGTGLRVLDTGWGGTNQYPSFN